MAGEWQHMSFADAIDIISGGTPKTTVPDYWNGDIPWLSVADFNNGYRWVSSAEKHITELGLYESATALLDRGDIIISARGTVGVLAQLARPMAFNQSCYGIRGKAGIAENDFLYYALRQAVTHMKQMAHGGVFDTITRDTFKILRVYLPPLPEQRAIAHILGTLDDKIELNRRMSETLEQMAQALFKSWFVDFDPVVVNALRAGNPLPEKFAKRAAHYRENPDALGLPDPILRLFPARFVDSELGEIPEGWEVGTVGSVIKRLPTGKKYEQKTVKLFGSVPVLDQGKSGLIGYHDETPGVIASEESPVAVFANHTCYMRLISFPFSTIQNVLPFIGNKVDTLWAYYATQGKQSFIEYKGHWPDFIRHKIVVSPPALTNEFAHVIRPLIRRVWKLDEESRTLAALRDALLPRLISGQLRVKDAERFLKERGL